jgi:uncharacterized protein
VIAVDTNILVYAHRREHEWHGTASSSISALAEGRGAWAIPWPCVHEFFAIVTRANIFDPPSTCQQAFAQLDAWFESPSLHLIGESAQHFKTLMQLATSAKLRGAAIHDARIAAICIDHGVSALWTADRDFSRFGSLKTRNPLAGNDSG